MVNMNDGTLLSFAVNQEKHVYKVLEKLVESSSMTEKNKKLLKPVPGTDRVLCTVHLRQIKQALRIARHFDQVCRI